MSGDSTSAEKRILEEDAKTLHHMGYAQELARRMGGFSNFAISFSIICILAGGITAVPVAFSAGGGFYVEPRTALVAFLVGLLYPVYTITGFDASAHTSEETKDARRSGGGCGSARRTPGLWTG